MCIGRHLHELRDDVIKCDGVTCVRVKLTQLIIQCVQVPALLGGARVTPHRLPIHRRETHSPLRIERIV